MILESGLHRKKMVSYSHKADYGRHGLIVAAKNHEQAAGLNAKYLDLGEQAGQQYHISSWIKLNIIDVRRRVVVLATVCVKRHARCEFGTKWNLDFLRYTDQLNI